MIQVKNKGGVRYICNWGEQRGQFPSISEFIRTPEMQVYKKIAKSKGIIVGLALFSFRPISAQEPGCQLKPIKLFSVLKQPLGQRTTLQLRQQIPIFKFNPQVNFPVSVYSHPILNGTHLVIIFGCVKKISLVVSWLNKEISLKFYFLKLFQVIFARLTSEYLRITRKSNQTKLK